MKKKIYLKFERWWLDKVWFEKKPRGLIFVMINLLRPFSWLYCLGFFLRRRIQVWTKAMQLNLRKKSKFKLNRHIPVVVVGNITLGGTGKTPLIMAIAEDLRKRGIKVGVVSRGYGGIGPYPCSVSGMMVDRAGDEPVLIALKMGIPVVVDPDRRRAIQMLLHSDNADGIEVILSDDGLQHYAMDRKVEIAVVDGLREFGNGLCLPAGPLREPVSRLSRCDFIIFNQVSVEGTRGVPEEALEKTSNFYDFDGADKTYNKTYNKNYDMSVVPEFFTQLKTGEKLTPIEFVKKIKADRNNIQVHVACGLGHPERFFRTLDLIFENALDLEESESEKIEVLTHAFPDHYKFTSQDFDFINKEVLSPFIILTEKDALKCLNLSDELQNLMWVLSIQVNIPAGFFEELFKSIFAPETKTGVLHFHNPRLPGEGRDPA
jgi:tetraacyldisaccharide 4'-kinase